MSCGGISALRAAGCVPATEPTSRDSPPGTSRSRAPAGGGGNSSKIMGRTGRPKWHFARLFVACLCVALVFVHASAPAHPGGLAGDGCHNHRASGTCHCHRAGASRAGCTNDLREDGSGGGGISVGQSDSGHAPMLPPML